MFFVAIFARAMNWLPLTDPAQLAEIDLLSASRPVLILKHSTRCSISAAALARLDRSDAPERLEPSYYLDLLRYRPLSNAIEARYGIEHASPQVLIIRNGKCVFDTSHFGIVFRDVAAAMERAQ
jgi:bacillithiol system protein YtxJ